MYQQMYEMITARLQEIGFTHVGSALAAPPPLSAVQVYLDEDKEITQTPQPHRQLTWVAVLTTGAGADGDADLPFLHANLDRLRQGFAGWNPEQAGITEPCMVPKITLAGHADHKETRYGALLVFRVIPTTFNKFYKE